MTPSPTAEEPMKEVLELIAFLKGEAPLDGVWFGDRHPTEKGAFWWRKRLDYIRTLVAGRSAAVGKAVEALENCLNCLSGEYDTDSAHQHAMSLAQAALAGLRSAQPAEVEIPPLPKVSDFILKYAGEIFTADQLRERDRQWAEALKAAGMEIKVKERG